MLEGLIMAVIVVALVVVAIWAAGGGPQGRGERARENGDAHHGGGANYS